MIKRNPFSFSSLLPMFLSITITIGSLFSKTYSYNEIQAPIEGYSSYEPVHKKGPGVPQLIFGLGLSAAGFFLASSSRKDANRYYEKYQQSAFTDNTEKFKEKTENADLLSKVGVGLMVIGGFTFVFSF